MNQDAVCFFTIANRAYFPGVVALINSLAITGNDYPIVVLDCGLTSRQHDLLLGYERCRVCTPDATNDISPVFYKAFAPLSMQASEVVVIIDSDMIVTGSLNAIIKRAKEGIICAFRNPYDRWFPEEWQEILDLPATPRQQPYICAGLVAFSVFSWPDLLRQWWDACLKIASHPLWINSKDIFSDSPVAQADQDVLNALLMSRYPQEAVSFLPIESQPCRWDFRHVNTLDVDTLACELRGVRSVILHASLNPKPWTHDGATHDVYFIFLRRLLTGPGLKVRIPTTELDEMLTCGTSGMVIRQHRFFRNMGALAYILSYCPHSVNTTALRVKRFVLRLLAKARRQHKERPPRFP